MKRNVEANGLGAISEQDPLDPSVGIQTQDKKLLDPERTLGMVRINEGDAWYVGF